MLLITGGLGYIASHVTISYMEKNPAEDVLLIDSCVNASLSRYEVLRGLFPGKVHFMFGDICNLPWLETVFKIFPIHAVIHCAGLKAVGESVQIPLTYYQNNLISTLNLLQLMKQHQVKTFIFSSSATIYGVPEHIPITESHPIVPTQPYGQTKAMIEQILADFWKAESKHGFKIVSLRYFNPTGCHPNGLVPEEPSGYPNNLFPAILSVIQGRLPELKIYRSSSGITQDTPDGTGVRDYIYVCDLADAHVRCLDYLKEKPEAVYDFWNVGTGSGYSVLDVVHEFEKQLEHEIPKTMTDPRPGDVPICIANVDKWRNTFQWVPSTPLSTMVQTALHGLKLK